MFTIIVYLRSVNSERNMKKWFVFLVLTLFICSSCKESKKERFQRVAKEYSKRCPVRVDENTRMDSMLYIPEQNINRYYYTLMGVSASQDSINKKRKTIEENLIFAVKNSIGLKEYKDYNTIIEYVFYSEKDSSELLKISVTPNRYK